MFVFEPRSAFSRATGLLASVALALSFVFSSAVPAFAAGGVAGNVSGTIQDEAGHPLPGATIALVSPSGTYRQQTDAHGGFLFLNVPIDTYTISVEDKGYEPFGQSGITVQGDVTVQLGTVKLASQQLKRIARVTARSASSAFQPNQTIPQFTVGGSVLQAAAGKAANADETSILLAAPGFQVDKTGGVILQGSTTDEVHFNFDGVDFTDPGFNGNANNYFFNGISNVQIVPGAGDPSQGDAGAGVVNLVVKRGTYPGSGFLDLEAVTRPYDHQLNLQYGIATSNNKFSDFISFFGVNNAYQYGPFGSNSFNESYGGASSVQYSLSDIAERDFVNNAVFHFGNNNSQSFQVLYYNNSYGQDGNYAGIPVVYDNVDPGVLSTTAGFTGSPAFPASAPYGAIPAFGGLTNSQVAAVMAKDAGFPNNPAALTPNPYVISTTSLLKFEYDNQLSPTTALSLRYFNSNIFTQDQVSGTEIGVPQAFPLLGQTAGGDRGGAILELTKQVDDHNLLTLSGNYEIARPNFGDVEPQEGLESLGPNSILFLNPPNPFLPATPTGPNACPVSMTTFPGACYLQANYYYKTGGSPPVPPLDLDSTNMQHFEGVGLRDQIQVNSKLRLDLGVRYDYIDEGFGDTLFDQHENTQPVPGAPGVPYIADYGFVDHPHFIEPRTGIAYRLGNDDSVAFTYGRSINETGSGEQASTESYTASAPFANIPVGPNFPWIPFGPFGNADYPTLGTLGTTALGPLCNPTIPYPLGAGPTTPPSYKGSVGSNLQLGRSCGNLASLLYNAQDAYFPEVAAVQPAYFNVYDFNYSHQFRDGSAIKIAPFFRQGFKIQSITAPLVFNPVTGVYSFGSLSSVPNGVNKTAGIDLQYTLPDRPYGLTGFFSASYVNEFTNTPPAGDNPYGQDFEPIILPQSYSTGNLYRAGFVSPYTMNMGLSYKTRSGFRINPVIHMNVGYPYNDGALTPVIAYNGAQNVANTNLTDQFGPAGAPYFIDPANPGSEQQPHIAASRGNTESPSGGGLLSRPQVWGDLTLEYSPLHSRSTFGVQILDVFNNAYYLTPSINPAYYPVTSGVAAPFTGQSVTGVAFPNEAPVVAKGVLPYQPYVVTAPFGVVPTLPTTFRLYYQLAL